MGWSGYLPRREKTNFLSSIYNLFNYFIALHGVSQTNKNG